MASEIDLAFVAAHTRGYLSDDGTEELAGIPTIMWGPSGTGKTARTKAMAATLGKRVEVAELSTCDPVDIGGLPVALEDVFAKRPNDRLVRASEDDCILVFDDFTAANRATQASSLQVIQNREFSDEHSLRRTPIFLMANPDLRSTIAAMSPAVANRLFHMEVSLRGDCWAYLKDPLTPLLSFGRREADAIRDDKVWYSALNRQVAIRRGFLRENSGCLEEEPEDMETALDHAYCTGRTLEMLERMLATAEICGYTDLDKIAVGCIGKVAAKKYLAFLAGHSIARADDVWAGKVTWSGMGEADIAMTLEAAARSVGNEKEVAGMLAAIEAMAAARRNSTTLALDAYGTLLDRIEGLREKDATFALPSAVRKQVEAVAETLRAANEADADAIPSSEIDLLFVAMHTRGFVSDVGSDGSPGKEMAGIPTIMWGPSGTGKTARTKDMARRTGRKMKTIELATCDTVDVGGLPVVRGNVMTKLPWDKLVDASREGMMIAFDDFTAANRGVQASSLQIVQNREFSDKYNLHDTPLVLMANIDARSTIAALSPAVANRLFHMVISHHGDSEQFLQTGKSQLHFGPDEVAKINDDTTWNRALQMRMAISRSFLDKFENVLEGEPEDMTEPLQHAYCTSRSLEMMNRLLATADICGYRDLSKIVFGCIGENAGAEYIEFLGGREMPSVADVLEGRVQWSALSDDIVAISLEAAASAVAEEREVEQLLTALETMMAVKSAPDLAVTAIRKLVTRVRVGDLNMKLAPAIGARADAIVDKLGVKESLRAVNDARRAAGKGIE